MQSLSARAHAHNTSELSARNHVLNAHKVVERSADARPDGVPQVLRGVHAEGGALGLDPSQTSVRTTFPALDGSMLLVDQRALKVKRARYSTLTAARLHMLEVPSWVGTFISLTYRPGCDYTPKDITTLIKRVRGWCDARGIRCRFLWVAEMQKRGVIHYHLIVFHPKKFTFPKPDNNGWWPHGFTNRSTGIRTAVAYMAKYLSKGDIAAFPKGARTYASGGLQGTAQLEMRWWKLPTWVRELVTPDDRAKRVLGGFVNRSTSEVMLTPWRVLFRGGMIYIQRKDAAVG